MHKVYDIIHSVEMCEFELPDVSLRCFVARQLLLQIYALSSVKFSELKLWLCKKCDKYEVCLCARTKNGSVMPLFVIFRPVRKKLQLTVSFDHPVADELSETTVRWDNCQMGQLSDDQLSEETETVPRKCT